MHNKDNDIYTCGLKPYKRRKLFFSSHFRSLYCEPQPDLSVMQCEYKLCTHMWLQRLREDDIEIVMAWWYRRHNIKGNWGRLRHQIIPETYAFAKPILKEQRHAEYIKAKEKALQKAGDRRSA